jgi:uncharacterized SAM-binding protein YcdF (DUF218 family)
MLYRSIRHGTVIIGIIGTGFLFWLAGLCAFLQSIPKQIEDTTTLTDTIVVLTGGSLRLQTGLELLQKGNAGKLFISGVHRGVDVQQLLRLARQSPIEADCCIFLGHEADDTAGNAQETAVWMDKHVYRSMRLVTAAYHMPRSIIEFRHAMPNTTILLHPVFPKQVKLDKWWMWPGTAGLILGEYSKYLISKTRHILTKLAG